MLWLQGGPGWPSAYGAFKEVADDHDHDVDDIHDLDHDVDDNHDLDHDVDVDHCHYSPGWPSAYG